MINIAFYCSDIRVLAGTERSSLTVANELSKLDNFKVFIISNQGEKNESKMTINSNIEVYNLRFVNRGLQYFSNILKINKFVKKNKIDVFVSVEMISVFFTLPALMINRNVKYIAWEHFNYTTNLGVRLRNWCRAAAAKFADGIVVLTQKDVQLWESNLKISGIICNINNPSPFDISENLYDNDSMHIIAIGRLVEQKGFDRLIDIWGEMNLRKLIPTGWKLQIIGSGPDQELLFSQAEKYKLGNLIEFISNTDSIKSYYEKASFLAMTSRFEGLPMTLIEAQSYGLPIIAYDCLTGPAEVISDKSGILIKDNDCEEFIEGLIALMGDLYLRQQMGKQAKIEAERFSPDQIREKWRKFILELHNNNF
ncbi:glycosyltransferase family 4 protein [Sphingobacterium siyangense]|uniref:glycosyltransferase family 4 protein n=1 Tax=Sphingobacterium siyangense TaxID=459529 RepID=UPI00301A7AE8